MDSRAIESRLPILRSGVVFRSATTGESAIMQRPSISKRVTIKDIAVTLGISHSTVSRALNDRPHVNADVRALVRTAAETAGYVGNSAARLMRGGNSSFVGLVIPEMQDEWDSAVAKSFSECCNAASMQMVLAVTEDDPVVEYRHVRALCEAEAAGIMIVPSRAPKRATTRVLRFLPVIQFVRRIGTLASDWVLTDDESGLSAATKHLLDLGHNRIGYIGLDGGLSTGAERLAGYSVAIRHAGLSTPRAMIETGPPRIEFGRHALTKLLSARRRPTAIIAASSHLTLGAIEAIQSLKMSVPNDLSLVGYGDPPWFKLWGPGITTLSLPVQEMVMMSSAALFRRISDSRKGIGRTERLVRTKQAPTLVIRGSTATI
jgi:LacI family transcriptional regulator